MTTAGEPEWWRERNGRFEVGGIGFLPFSERNEVDNIEPGVMNHPVLFLELFRHPTGGSGHAWILTVSDHYCRLWLAR